MDLVCTNLCCRISWHLKCIRMIAAMYISSMTILRNFETELQSPHKNLAWSEMGACLGQYCKLCMKPVGQSETMHSCTAVNSSQGKHSWLQWCREKFFQRGQILVMAEGHHNIFLEAAGQQCHQWSHSGKLRHGTCGFYTRYRTARKFRGVKFFRRNSLD